MDSVAISEDSLEHSEHGTQNATQCPAWFPSWLILRCDYIATTAAITHRLGTFETSMFRVLFRVPTSQPRHYRTSGNSTVRQVVIQ